MRLLDIIAAVAFGVLIGYAIKNTPRPTTKKRVEIQDAWGNPDHWRKMYAVFVDGQKKELFGQTKPEGWWVVLGDHGFDGTYLTYEQACARALAMSGVSEVNGVQHTSWPS